MADFPAPGYLSDAARTQSEVKTALEDFLASTRELIGSQAESTLTIASGSVTPTRPIHSVDTEGGAANDDLTHIAQTNLDDGRLLLIRCASANRVVVVKHAAGGAGQISLQTPSDRQLRDPKEWLLLKRTGSLWEQVLVSGTGVPVGALTLFAGGVVPVDWLLCDGAAVSRATYAALFAAVGTTWGTGDGSTTFNVPDLRGRMPLGAGTGSGLTARTLGSIGGEQAHTLTTTETPSHAHGVTDPGHTHGVATAGAGEEPPQGAGLAVTSGQVSAFGTTAAGTGISIQAAGGGAAHNVMNPFAVVQYIIRT